MLLKVRIDRSRPQYFIPTEVDGPPVEAHATGEDI